MEGRFIFEICRGCAEISGRRSERIKIARLFYFYFTLLGLKGAHFLNIVFIVDEISKQTLTDTLHIGMGGKNSKFKITMNHADKMRAASTHDTPKQRSNAPHLLK